MKRTDDDERTEWRTLLCFWAVAVCCCCVFSPLLFLGAAPLTTGATGTCCVVYETASAACIENMNADECRVYCDTVDECVDVWHSAGATCASVQ